MRNYPFEEKYGRLRQQLVAGGITLAGIVLLGTLWYHFVEKMVFVRVRLHDHYYSFDCWFFGSESIRR